MAREYDVITLGSARLDAFMTIHDPKKELHKDQEHQGGVCFRLGEKIVVDKYDFFVGGNAANVAVGISRMGLKSTIVAEVGDDEFSIKIRNMLARENIERLFLVQTKGGSSNLSVIISFAGDRTIFAESREQEHDFSLDGADADWLYITSLGREWEKPYKMALDFAKEKGARIAFNPGSYQLSEGHGTTAAVLKQTEILFVNKEEAELLIYNHYKKKIDNSDGYIEKLARELKNMGPKIVVITNGKYGSHALDASGNFGEQALVDGEVVERTGAGDAYATGFLAAVIHGKNFQEAMKWGAHNASSVVGKVGAQMGLLTKAEIEELVK